MFYILDEICFFNGLSPATFFNFRSFQTQILQKQTVCCSGIRTRIVGLEGEHADHLTTTTAPSRTMFIRPQKSISRPGFEPVLASRLATNQVNKMPEALEKFLSEPV